MKVSLKLGAVLCAKTWFNLISVIKVRAIGKHRSLACRFVLVGGQNHGSSCAQKIRCDGAIDQSSRIGRRELYKRIEIEIGISCTHTSKNRLLTSISLAYTECSCFAVPLRYLIGSIIHKIGRLCVGLQPKC